ncbi:hypothetical protein BDF22DRAFT_694459 [Syncephalis plumigaleata]|nr:hypothetical protein BDF22DRAFT_694459 [Syncephalis plumigaleata]
MRSLLHQTIVAITAVLVLISCASQTQAIGGSITGIQDPDLYARSYIEQKAAEEGLSDLRWIDGRGSTISITHLKYGEKPAYMMCTTSDSEKAVFDALMNARTTLKGANEEYRNYVKYPLKAIAVPEGPSRPAGYCFIYRNIDGKNNLWNLIFEQHYADKLITVNQAMPQILKGFIYLFNAGIRDIKLDLGEVMIQQLPTGQLKPTIFAFDVTKLPQPPIKQLNAAIMPAKSSPNSPNPYTCNGFHQALYFYILQKIDPSIVADPLKITSEGRIKIAEYIKQNSGPAVSQS